MSNALEYSAFRKSITPATTKPKSLTDQYQNAKVLFRRASTIFLMLYKTNLISNFTCRAHGSIQLSLGHSNTALCYCIVKHNSYGMDGLNKLYMDSTTFLLTICCRQQLMPSSPMNAIDKNIPSYIN